MNAGETAAAVIGKSVQIRGEVKGSEDLMVDGHVEGTITLIESRLTIGPNAHVAANVAARDVILLGHLSGNVTATGRVELRDGFLCRKPDAGRTHQSEHYRLSPGQYRAMAEWGILTADDRIELLEGWLVAKMTKNPPHEIAKGLTQDHFSMGDGKLIVKVVPVPTTLDTSILASWASTMALAIAKPSPLRPDALERDLSAR